jgi:uncharacterized protein (DUF1015 family)
MANIQPFRALRPRAELTREIAAPPYDVLSRKEAQELIARNPRSFMRVIRADAETPEIDRFDERVFEAAKRNLDALIAEGAMRLDDKPAFYLYQLELEGHVQTGIVAAGSLAEYEADTIKRHEKTRKPELEGRTRHILHSAANTGPVFLTYRSRPAIDEVIARLCQPTPSIDFTADDGVRHRVWVVDGSADVGLLIELFREVPALYIADGHHRSAASSRVRKALREQLGASAAEDLPCDHFLVVAFPHDQLRILAYNRVIKDLNGKTPDQIKQAVSERFEIEPTDEPVPPAPKQFGMYLDGQWYRLRARADSFDANDALRSLDVAILQQNLIRPILGIENPRTDPRIKFIGGIRGAKELERRVNEGGGVAFYLYPVLIEEVMRIADEGEVMPPKSTWFEPKLRSGLIVRVLDEEAVEANKAVGGHPPSAESGAVL